MDHTQNYQLSQWERTDKVQMEDFNADNAKIDAALKAEADARTAEMSALTGAVAKLGNAVVQYDVYQGNGKTSRTFTFPHRPLLVVIFDNDGYLFAVQGVSCSTFRQGGTGSAVVSTTWEENTVCFSKDSAFQICNDAKRTSHMVVLMSAED